MAPVSLNLVQVPIYGLIAGAVVFTYCVLKAVRSYEKWNFARRNGCKAPVHSVSHGILGIGMIMEMTRAGKEHNFLELLRGWHRSYGKTYIARQLAQSIIFTVEPKNIQTILALKFKDFSTGQKRQKALSPVFGEGIFTVDGTRWEHSRALLRPNFSRAQITNTQLYEDHVSDLLKRIPRDGSTVELQELFLNLTLDTSTEFLLGESVHSLKNDSPEASRFSNIFNTALDGSAMRLRLGPLMDFYWNKDFKKAGIDMRSYVGRFVQKAIDYRVSVNSGGKVDQEIKQLTDNQYVFSYELTKQTLDKKEITDQILSILIAGRDTTANLLSITFFVMAKRPDIWKKLQAEVLTLEGLAPSFEELKSMTYLTWVFNETLRLHPIAPFNQRTAIRDTYLPTGGGPDGESPVFVPKGTEVIYSIYTTHRDSEVYGPDADEYRPERWEKLRPGWAYLPFNGGPRICIGQQFALTEAGYTLVRIMQEFKNIESRDPNPFVEDFNLTLSSANGTKVSLTPASG